MTVPKDPTYNIIKRLHCIIVAIIIIVLCSRYEFSYASLEASCSGYTLFFVQKMNPNTSIEMTGNLKFIV